MSGLASRCGMSSASHSDCTCDPRMKSLGPNSAWIPWLTWWQICTGQGFRRLMRHQNCGDHVTLLVVRKESSRGTYWMSYDSVLFARMWGSLLILYTAYLKASSLGESCREKYLNCYYFRYSVIYWSPFDPRWRWPQPWPVWADSRVPGAAAAAGRRGPAPARRAASLSSLSRWSLRPGDPCHCGHYIIWNK